MIAALSPLESWAVFLGCVAVGVTVYAVTCRLANADLRSLAEDVAETQEWERQGRGLHPWEAPRVRQGVYDHETRGDFR